jgi:hypothetical protein
MIGKPFIYLFDSASFSTFIGGIITGHELALLLGGIASVCAALNHGYDFIKKIKKNKKTQS